jgi:protoporphyrinogen oxidase
MSADYDVLVIGAGPAGLTAAYQLSQAGKRVIVIERDEQQVGGISRTVNYKNYLFDIGGHRFFSKSREVVALWDEILPDDFIERPRLSRIYYDGKFYAYPLNAFQALRNLGIIESLRCMASYVYAQLTPISAPRSFHQWVRNQFGERLFSIFFKTYTEKVWGMSCDAISADWAAQRIKGLSLGTAVWHAVTRMWRGGTKPASTSIKTLIESFRYPRKGPGQLWDPCAAKIIANGGVIKMGRTLATLSHYDDVGLWCVEVRNSDGTLERYKAQHVISSAPITELMSALKPGPISRLHARDLKYRDFLTVALIAHSSKDFPDNWIYIHDPSVLVGRVQNFRSWSPHLVPDDNMTCLGLEYFCFEGDGLWTSGDDELIALAKKEIVSVGLLRAEDVVDACVVRQPKAYPVYDDAYRSNIEMVRRDVRLNYRNLHLVGRNGMHKYNNQDHAMMTAMLTVRNILAGKELYDVWAVNEDAQYHEAGGSGEQQALASVRMVPERLKASA